MPKKDNGAPLCTYCTQLFAFASYAASMRMKMRPKQWVDSAP